LALALLAPAAARAEAVRIVPVEVLVACDEDDADRLRVEGQLSDLAVEVRALRGAEAASPPASGALRIAFETTEDRSRRVTLTVAATGKSQSRRVELPNGPAALSAQRESIALTARRMVKAQLEAPPVEPESQPMPGDPWRFGALAGASGALAAEGTMMGLRGEIRALVRRGGLRMDVGFAGVQRSFDADGYQWTVAGLGPVALLGVEAAWEHSRLYAGIGASYVISTSEATVSGGPISASDAVRSFVLPRLEVAWFHDVATGLSLGVSIAAESELPRTDYKRTGSSGSELLATSAIVEPSFGVQLAWDAEAR
jgi:hypothetical protein